MIFRLALRNVKKSYRDFFIYFLTLSFSVCLFYTFNSFYEQQSLLSRNSDSASVIQQLAANMTFLSIFVSIILCFLMLYANSFIIKRRKKELGIYMMLGMSKRKVSSILVCETMLIGLISLITGLLIGIFLSQVLAALNANLFEVTLHYHFVFSWFGIIVTLIFFISIFLLLMLLNTLNLHRYPLVDLLQADKKTYHQKSRKLHYSLLLFLFSIGFIAYAYALALQNDLKGFEQLHIIIISGSIGTFLFFSAFSGFLQFLMQQKKIYFHHLNFLVLRQLNQNVRSNSFSMSITCIMLLLSIGSLATCLNIKNSINHTLLANTPYDFSLEAPYFYDNVIPANQQSYNLKERIDSLHLDTSYIQNIQYITTYIDTITLKGQIPKELASIIIDNKMQVTIVSVSDYNQVMKDTNHPMINLKENQAFLYNENEMIRNQIEAYLKKKPTISLYEKNFQIINTTYDPYALSTDTSAVSRNSYLVLPDHQINEHSLKFQVLCNITLTDQITPTDFQTYLSNKIDTLYGNSDEDFAYDMTLNNVDTIRTKYIGTSVIMTYTGIYLGIIFLISSAAILAIQQLSLASSNRRTYQLLHKLGVEQSMADRMLMLQIGCYFLLPILLAGIHSIVGIHMVSRLVLVYGKGNILQASLFTSIGFFMLYGFYFAFTYSNYKNILTHRNRY